ncbi:Retrovirus-related Pol polyprotein from transposon [Zancudomyces culisetae]|uniref:Retrovirus-related Pol polyprotein from transposon n=1 Tax=Zancudomyces culisetae TaxID=1213189 RepID=A0A1R1PLF4_ZANCU|nr:Retrovirus-related Pol polyprotein from transposon [Zancudomyces culisetae]|eukprot:OMH81800.1 Retrovirus-related Pol polyprotein from transposon [Zancudomyces culisetae]
MEINKHNALKQYLNDRTYPNLADEEAKRKIRLHATRYILKDGVLFAHSKKFGLREVLSEENAYLKIKDLHNHDHTGISNTWEKVKLMFTGPNTFEIVKKVVNFCEVCQRFKGGPKRRNEMVPITASEPFEILGIDAIGPISPVSRDGNRYIITAMDYYTKWPISKAVENIQTETIVHFLVYDVIMNHGVPRKLISDRGSGFISEIADEFYKFVGIEHHPTTSYRPQSNGQVERFNQTLKNVLSKLCWKDKENWDRYLWRAMLIARTMKHRILGVSPSKMLYGSNIRTPVTWTSEVTNENETEAFKERLKFVEVNLPVLRDLASQKIIKNKEYEVQRYNKKVTVFKFKLLDKVLKKVEMPTSKFSAIWEGPYTIVRVLDKGTYIIRDEDNNLDQVNGDRLKKYKESENMCYGFKLYETFVSTGQCFI